MKGGSSSGVGGERLYAWQAEALTAWTDAGRRGIVEAVTGTGKTRVGLEAIKTALDEGRHAVVLVPTRVLQEQWRKTLRGSLPHHVRVGLLGEGNRDDARRCEVLVAIVNSARDRGTDAPEGSLLVADECHRYASTENIRALTNNYGMRLGLTATLKRPDRLETKLIDYFGPVCYGISYARALADAVVAQFSVTLIGVPMTEREAMGYQALSKRIGDSFSLLVHRHGFPKAPFHEFMRAVQQAAENGSWSPATRTARAFLEAIFERKGLLANSPSKHAVAVDLAPAMCAADRVLVFTETTTAADDLACALRGQNLSAAAIHSGLGPSKRKQILGRFESGALQVIVSPRVLDEGVDVPSADLAVIVAASRTRRQMIQRMGRVLRRKSDDRLARIAILYLEDTTEDPGRGAHEAFLGEVTSIAEDLDDFACDHLEEALAFLCITDPIRPSAQPRLHGEPPRPSTSAEADDEAIAAAQFLGLISEPEEPTSTCIGRSQ